MFLKNFNSILLLTLAGLLISTCSVTATKNKPKYTSQDVKCQVCKTIVRELKDDVAKVNPSKTVEVGGYRLDGQGNYVTKTVPMAKSELFLSDIMENVCSRMEDYVKATYRSTGELILLKIMVNGAMNPETTNVDIVQDDDLNRSLSHYCLDIIENMENVLMKIFQADKEPMQIENHVCALESSYCLAEDEYEQDNEILGDDERIYNEEL